MWVLLGSFFFLLGRLRVWFGIFWLFCLLFVFCGTFSEILCVCVLRMIGDCGEVK